MAKELANIQALSIRPGRLAGSDNCLNCGTGLEGPFCYYCGQPDKRMLRFFPVLMRELLEDFIDFDSRFARTIKPLLFRPGTLTRNYLDGKRFRYTPPIRLYLFSSLFFFLLATLFTFFSVDFSGLKVSTSSGINFTIEDEAPPVAESELRIASDPKLDEVGPAVDGEGVEDAAVTEPLAGAGQQLPWYEREDNELTLFGKPWHPVDNPVNLGYLPDRTNQWINSELIKSEEKGKQIADDPGLIIGEMINVLPQIMFIMLPVFALILKFFYLFAKRFYVEHLIFALHNHSFIFVVFILLLGLEGAEAAVTGGASGWLAGPLAWGSYLLGAWVPVYLFLAMKKVYQQGWFLTTVKYLAVGLSYLILLIMITGLVAMIGFLRV